MKYNETAAIRYTQNRNRELDSSDYIIQLLLNIISSCDVIDTILDLGCGPGFYARRLRNEVDQAITIHLLDHSPAMLSLAKRQCADLPHMKLQLADICAMPYSTGAFTMCYAINVLHQTQNCAVALQQIDRVLRPGGFFVLLTPSRDRLREFPLFAANLKLAERQVSFLPRMGDILAASNDTSLKLQTMQVVRSQDSISSAEFIRLINERFLSILCDCPSSDIDGYANKTEQYLALNRVNAVMPYWYDFILMRKKRLNNEVVL